MHRHECRNDGADASSREALLPVDPRRRSGAVIVVDPTRNARAEQPIVDRQIREPERREYHVTLDETCRRGRRLRLHHVVICLMEAASLLRRRSADEFGLLHLDTVSDAFDVQEMAVGDVVCR